MTCTSPVVPRSEWTVQLVGKGGECGRDVEVLHAEVRVLPPYPQPADHDYWELRHSCGTSRKTARRSRMRDKAHSHSAYCDETCRRVEQSRARARSGEHGSSRLNELASTRHLRLFEQRSYPK